MLIKKCVTALAVCSLVCIAVLGLRTRADAQHDEKKAEDWLDYQGSGRVVPDRPRAEMSKAE